MDNFYFFLKQGLSHILDTSAIDHILFIIALAILYHIKEWKQLLVLITAFTIGHSMALGLATFEAIKANTSIVEFLIPLSIIVTCIWNGIQLNSTYLQKKKLKNHQVFHVEHFSRLKYGIVLFFGLIHGLGFSNYLRFILDSDEGILIPLLAFNIGLEIGQILIVSIVLIINFVLLDLLKIQKKQWASLASFIVILLSIPIAIETGKSLFIEH
jgi:ABC-type antimicrobial peptide transport system permease subunit